MPLPAAPPIRTLQSLTPSIYEAALKCMARAAWLVSGQQAALPSHPRTLLGTAFHSVLEGARSRALGSTTGEERRRSAETAFDERMRALFDAAHPLLRAKFEMPERIPFYHLFRARAARMAGELAARTPARAPVRPAAVEARLSSRDGRLSGRPDYIDQADAAVVDYKTGGLEQPAEVSDAERRQLKLYAFLASENGIEVRKGAIVRADGRRIEFLLDAGDAADEAQRALEILEAYNRLAGRPFSEAASPSLQNCKFCPCIPFCDSFWQAAEPGWADDCGVHLEGEVRGMQGTDLMSIDLNLLRGTAEAGAAVLTRMSNLWLTYEEPLPAIGQIIRITNATYVPDTVAPAVFRADRIATVVWRAPPPR